MRKICCIFCIVLCSVLLFSCGLQPQSSDDDYDVDDLKDLIGAMGTPETLVEGQENTPEVTTTAPSVTTMPATTTAPPATTTVPPVTTTKQNGLSSEFKAAMDSYEAYMDEYVAFMKKYQANSSDMKLILEYAKVMAKYAEFSKDFEKWEDEDLNEAETLYYIDVQTRVNKKLLEIAY